MLIFSIVILILYAVGHTQDINVSFALMLFAGIVLSCTGSLPDVIQTESALFGIRRLFGPIPAFFFILAMITLYFYPINEKRYNEILVKIKDMESSGVKIKSSEEK